MLSLFRVLCFVKDGILINVNIFVPFCENWSSKNNITSNENKGRPDCIICIDAQLKVAYLDH